MPIALGLDLGTTSISAVAVADDGTLLAALSRPHAADVAGLPAGHAEQDPQRIRDVACQVLRDLQAGLPDAPAVLGLTGQMHGILLLDRTRQPLSNLMTWQDRRAMQRDPATGRPWLELLRERAPADAVCHAGCRFATGFGGATLDVLRQTGCLPTATAGAALIVDWLAAEFTGGEIITDPSNAASLGLFDLSRNDWSGPLLRAAGVAREWLPRVQPGGSIIGHLCAASAAETGLPAGLPIGNAVGDNAAAIVGSVPLGEEVVQVNIGTGGQLARIIPGFQTLEGMETRPLPPSRAMLVGAGLAGGDAFAWVQRTVAAWLRAFGVEPREDDIYARLDRLMHDAPRDAGGLTCAPFFRGTRAEPQRRGEFHGVGVDNFSPGGVGRAVVNGIAAGMRHFYDLAQRAGPWPVRRIIATGNAVRRNPLLTQSIADALGLPLDVPRHREEAAYGAALLAGAQGIVWSDLAAASLCVLHERVAEPQRTTGA